jgi:hypothetical protein
LGDEWSLRAGEDTDWKVVFHRRIDGDIGEPDATVDVETDSIVRLTGETRRVKAFSDSQEVTVPPCRSVWLHGRDAPLVAKFLLDGWHLRVTHSAGSTHRPVMSNPPVAAARIVSTGPLSGTMPEANEILFIWSFRRRCGIPRRW